MAVLGYLAVAAGVAGVVAHFRAPGSGVALGVSAFSPYLMLCSPLALLLLGVSLRRWALVLPGAATLFLLFVQAPLFVAQSTPVHARDLRVMTLNLRLGQADPDSVVAAARHSGAEVLMLEELTASEQDALETAGLDRLLPYRATDPRNTAQGTGLWSRYPLRDVTRHSGFTFALVTARVAVPGVPREALAVALHMAGPWPQSQEWERDITRLASYLPQLAHDGPTVVGGDFNATQDVPQFRDLLRDGYHDAVEQSGAGFQPTFPADHWPGPMIGIDHVLLRDAVARSAHTVSVRGSDHRALVAVVALDRQAG